jgi:virginiamycin B lyase
MVKGGPGWSRLAGSVSGRCAALLGAVLAAMLIAGAVPTYAYIYWTNFGPDGSGTTIGRANLNGTNVNESFITGALTPVGIAVAGTSIYWSNINGPGCSGTAIGRASLTGAEPSNDFLTVEGCPHGLAVGSPYIYWADRTGTTIGRANINGTEIDNSFIGGAEGAHDVALGGSYIYWSNYNGTTIGRANINGSEADQHFITEASKPAGIAVNGDFIYWANNGGTTIGRATIAGTEVNQSFITGADNPIGLAVNGSYIYWANYGSTDASGGGSTIGRANLNGTEVDQHFITGASTPTYLAINESEPTAPPPPTEEALAGTHGIVSVPTNQQCVSRRDFIVHIRELRGLTPYRQVAVVLNGRRVRTERGKQITARIDLRGLPKGRYVVTIAVETKLGKSVTGTRTYHTCAPRPIHPKTPPKL